MRIKNHHGRHVTITMARRHEADAGYKARSRANTTPSATTLTIVSITVHVFSVVGTSSPRYSLTSQKPPSLTWLAMSEPAPSATTSSSRLVSGRRRQQRRDDGGRRGDGHRGRSDRDAQERRDQPPKYQRRQLPRRHRRGNRAADAGLIEHSAESTAGADDQQHAGDWEERTLGDGQQLRAAKPATRAEDVGRDQRADEQRDRGVPQKHDPRRRQFPCSWNVGHFDHGRDDRRAEHERDRQKHRGKRDRDGRRVGPGGRRRRRAQRGAARQQRLAATRAGRAARQEQRRGSPRSGHTGSRAPYRRQAARSRPAAPDAAPPGHGWPTDPPPEARRA